MQIINSRNSFCELADVKLERYLRNKQHILHNNSCEKTAALMFYIHTER